MRRVNRQQMRLLKVTNWNIAAALLILPGLAGCARSIGENPATAHEEHEEPAVVVRVAPAEYRTLPQTVRALGQCEAPPGSLAMLTPALEGHVHSILVEQGASVKAGQRIIELDPSLPAADLAEKTAARDAAKASLEVLRSLPRPEEQQTGQLAIEQARVALERAQSLLANLKPLAARNEVSPQQLFDTEKAVEQARLQKESAEAQFRITMLGPRAEAEEEGKARIQMAEQAAKTSQVRLDLHTIRAPIDGVLQDLTCHPGQTIAAGTPVGEIVDSRQLYVLAWLTPRSARAVRVGQKAAILVATGDATASSSAGPDTSHTDEPTIGALVVFVGQVADAQTGNLSLRCLMDNRDARLAVGQTVNLSITVDEGVKVLSVPVQAIFDLGEGPIVCVVREGKAVQLHPRLGVSHDGWVAVTDTDLADGERVIVEGGYNLDDNTPVRVEGAPAAGVTHDDKG